jgi:hypothetical protein
MASRHSRATLSAADDSTRDGRLRSGQRDVAQLG